MDTIFKEKVKVLSEAEICRAITRIAHEIIEKNRGAENIALVGVLRRGVPLAKRIAERIRSIEGISVPVGTLDISRHRDDIAPEDVAPVYQVSEINFDIDSMTVILIDDVICSGRTVRAAIEALFRMGRPKMVQLAVLVDRGLRELPFRPDFVGKNLPTSRSELVKVRLQEIDGHDSVTIYK